MAQTDFVPSTRWDKNGTNEYLYQSKHGVSIGKVFLNPENGLWVAQWKGAWSWETLETCLPDRLQAMYIVEVRISPLNR